MNLFFYQIKQAYLSLKQKPGFVFSVVTTMGITLGALLCTITLNYLLLIEPLPYPEQNRLFVADHKIIDANQKTKTIAYSYPNLEHLYKSKTAFEQAAMVYYDQNVMTSHDNQPLINTTYVTPEFHQMLASPIKLGRIFEASEALETYHPVAVISYDTWQQTFVGKSNILEQKIVINDVSYRIIGVLSEDFYEPSLAEIGRKTDIWLPWDLNPDGAEQRNNFGNIKDNLKFIGKLSNGITQDQVHQQITPFLSEYWQEGFAKKYEFFKGWSIDMEIRSIQKVIHGDSQNTVMMLLAGVVGLVIIASTNISNLLMSRTIEQQRQIAIKTALGARKKHIFKGMLAETILLMLMSTILALVLNNIGISLIQQYLHEVLPRVNELSFSIVTLGVAILVTLLLALFFAKLSTRIVTYKTLNTTLQSSGKSSGIQVSKKIRHSLITCQITLATTLVFANIILFKNALETINAPIGFTTKNISTLVLNFSSIDSHSEEDKKDTMNELMNELEALPQIDSIIQGSSPLDSFSVKALTKLSSNVKFIPYFKRIDQNYFSLIEQPFLKGENLSLSDRRDNNNVMIVNQAFAEQLKPDGEVIGMHLSSIGEPNFKIIGVVKNIFIPNQVAFGSDDTMAAVPRSYAPVSLNEQQFMLKIKPGQSISRQQLSKVLTKVDSRYSVLNFHTTSDLLKKSLFAKVSITVTTAMLASLVLMLASLGLYGIFNYASHMRRFEIGARMAIGAKGNDIITMVLKDNSLALLMGIVVSILILVGLYVGFSDNLTSFISLALIPVFIGTLGLIALISFLACYLPLRQYINKPAIHSLLGAE